MAKINNKNKYLPTILLSGFAVLIIGGLIYLSTSQSSSNANIGTPGPAVLAGQSEKDFTLTGINNQKYTLSAYKGQKAVFLEFFAVWCPHCQAMAPKVDALYNEFKDKDIQFFNVQASAYGTNYEQGDSSLATLSDLKYFQQKFKVPYPILQDYSIKNANAYGVTGYPTFYVINKDGKVTYTNNRTTSGGGEEDPTVIENAIKQVL